jgi:hypothetical protein
MDNGLSINDVLYIIIGVIALFGGAISKLIKKAIGKKSNQETATTNTTSVDEQPYMSDENIYDGYRFKENEIAVNVPRGSKPVIFQEGGTFVNKTESENKDKESVEPIDINLSDPAEARRAFILSEIFNRKY